MDQAPLKFKIIPTTELKVGMYVQDVGRGWFQHPWLTKSKFITSPSEISRLKDFGIKEVVVNTSLGVIARPVILSEPDAPATPAPKELEEIERRTGPRVEEPTGPVPIEVELPRARDAMVKSANSVRYFVDSLQTGKRLNLKIVNNVLDEIIGGACRNQDAFLTLAKIRQYEQYDFQHPLLVTVLSVCFGRYLGMDKEQLRNLGLGAMLQDVGKTLMPTEIIKKPARLTAEELEVVREHSVVGARMLKACAELPREAMATAMFHHERLDGSGYPRGLRGDQLTPNLVICGLADVFDALTTDRVHQRGCLPYIALRELFKMRGKEFPAPWVDRFIHCLGIYPTGTVVELNTGETAVVLGVNHAQLLRPKIKILTDSQGRPLVRTRAIDLNSATHEQRFIREVLHPKKVGIDPAIHVDPQT